MSRKTTKPKKATKTEKRGFGVFDYAERRTEAIEAIKVLRKVVKAAASDLSVPEYYCNRLDSELSAIEATLNEMLPPVGSAPKACITGLFEEEEPEQAATEQAATEQAATEQAATEQAATEAPEKNISEGRLEQIHDDLVAADRPCEMSGVLTPLSGAELDAAYEDLLVQYGQELAIGALERSEWLGGNLIVSANQASILFLKTTLDAMRGEMERRKASVVGLMPAIYALPN